MKPNTIQRRILAALATISFAITGCAKQGAGENSESSTIQSLSCKSTGEVDPDSLSIVGADSAQAGSLVSYHLNQDMGCSKDQKVAWKTVAPGSTYKDGNDLTTSFSKAGEYVVVASVQSASSSEPTLISQKTTVVSGGFALTAPEYGMARMPASFSVAAPQGVGIVSVNYTWGDTSAPQTGTAAITHTYMAAGTYSVTASVLDTTGARHDFTRTIRIIPLLDGFECVTALAISGATEAQVGQAVPLSVFLPPCVGSRVNGVNWNFGDGGTASGQNTSHAFTAPGTYTVTVAISVIGAPVPNPMFTLSLEIKVGQPAPNPEPTPTPTPTPNPTPDPLACPALNQTRETLGDIFTEEKSCGVGGTRNDSFRNRIVETCKVKNGETLAWVETSRTKELVGEGQCTGEYCELPAEAMAGVGAVAADVVGQNGKYYLRHGRTLTFYSSQSPEGACSTVAQTRTCSNGNLSGTSTHKFLMCENGCTGFGPNGTVKTGVVTGEESVAKTCAFNETGITDLFYTIADQKCNLGSVVTDNTRRGSIKSEGVCPTYQWLPTEAYTECNANCGGTQSLIYVCKDSNGNTASADRCSGQAPVITRVCDGNPEAVRRSESVTENKDSGSSEQCPANQIGVITKSRDVTTTTTFACIDHEVKQESQEVTYSDWVEERYCRDYVGYRCSLDSLTNTQANGRYKWLLKCKDQVPMIAEFLTHMENIRHADRDGDGSFGLGAKGRVLYPTFMDRNGKVKNGVKGEKPWIAPIDDKGSCVIPESVYIAGVCVSSCATPEMQIMVQAEKDKKLKYARFDEAWQDKIKFVATLQSASAMSSKQVQKTAVDQWVTEIADAEHEIIEFRMKSGGVLRLTTNHPIVTADGFMKTADQFKVGDSLVQLGGVLDKIESAEHKKYFGKVYNVFVKSADLHHNVVVTQGYLNGTAMYQNEGAKFLNTEIFRRKLTRGVFGK